MNTNIEKLLNGAILYLEDSNVIEKRLYRYSSDSENVEYSDDNKNWYISNMNLSDFENKKWIEFEE